MKRWSTNLSHKYITPRTICTCRQAEDDVLAIEGGQDFDILVPVRRGSVQASVWRGRKHLTLLPMPYDFKE